MRGACAVLLLAACSFRLHEAATDGSVERDGPKAGSGDAPLPMPAFVQQAIASADNSNSPLVATLAGRPSAGHLLVVIGGDSHGALTSVTGGGVTTWTRATRSLANVNIEVWFGITDGSTAAVTVAYPANNNPIWQLVTEWSGVASTNILDAAMSMSGTSSPATAGAAVVAPREIALFAAADLTPNTFGTPAQGTWTALMPVSSSSTTQQVWYAIATTAGSLAPSVTETAHSWDAAIASFHAAD